MRPFAVLLAACLAALPASGQMLPQADIDLFGDAHVKKLDLNDGPFARVVRADEPETKESAKGYEHALLFHDGRVLRGNLVELSAEKVLWHRPDAQAALEFKRTEIRRILLDRSENPASAPPRPAGAPMLATVKVAGCGWLFGEFRLDGKTQEVSTTVRPDATLRFPRSAIEWVYFGRRNVPAFSFTGTGLGMDGWTVGGKSGGGVVEEGAFKLPEGGWIGRACDFPDRVEIDFAIPDDKQSPRIFLQPWAPSPNTYSTGTIELAFRARDMSRLIYFEEFKRENSDYPKECQGGPARYRVFADRKAERLVVMRNDTVVGDWKMRPPAPKGEERDEIPKWQGLCLDAGYGNSQFTVRNIRVAPWDGSIPTGGAQPVPRMSKSDAQPTPGKLESTDGLTAIVDGKSMKVEEGMLFHLAQTPPDLPDQDALLCFGPSGEVAVAGLEIRGGRVKARSAVQPNIDLPSQFVTTIGFPSRKVDAGSDPDVLVFRNGDSMPGKLIAAASDGPLRWKGEQGREWQFETKNIAGTRLGVAKPAAEAPGCTVEMTNGDRLSGELTALETESVELRHSTLGTRKVSRAQLTTLYPNRAVIFDPGSDPEAWLGLAQRGKANLLDIARRPDPEPGRVYLDGVFLTAPRNTNTWDTTGLSRSFDKVPDRFELRYQAADAGGNEPYVTTNLSGYNGTPTVQVWIGNSHVRISAYNIGRNQSSRDREMPLTSKLAEHFSRREVRIFVNSKRGTLDILVDGVPIMKFGYEDSESVPGIGSHISFSSYATSNSTSILSNVWMGPWNGDVPRKGNPTEGALLNNGDIAGGKIGELRDGALTVGDGADAIDIPIKRITSLAFGAPVDPEKPAARARLIDGTILNLRDFRWENGVLRGTSAILGAVEIPEAQVTQLALTPAVYRICELKDPTRFRKPEQAAAAEPEKEP